MRLIAFGINHKTAPVAIREQAAFAPEQLPQALSEITAQAGVDEATISRPATAPRCTAGWMRTTATRRSSGL